jgi:ubiquinone/menaquinone biosynthesis C-methylase UbiE
MGKPFDPKNLHKLDNPKRREILPPEEILDIIGIREGDTLIDIGCGAGYFLFPGSKIIGRNGKIIALDISPEMLEELKRRIRQNPVDPQIEYVELSGSEFPVSSDLCDQALLALVLHEVEPALPFLSEIFRILKPGGTLSIIEWCRHETEMGPPLEERLAVSDVTDLLTRAGFQLKDHREIRQTFDLYRFSKPEHSR